MENFIFSKLFVMQWRHSKKEALNLISEIEADLKIKYNNEEWVIPEWVYEGINNFFGDKETWFDENGNHHLAHTPWGGHCVITPKGVVTREYKQGFDQL